MIMPGGKNDVPGLADVSAELPPHRRMALQGEDRHQAAPKARPPADPSFLGIGPGGWTGASALYALVAAVAVFLSWSAVAPAPWPDTEPAFRVVFEAPPEPATPAPATPVLPPQAAAPAPATDTPPPAEAAPPPPEPAPVSVADAPPPPARKPHPPAPRAPAPAATASETQVAAAGTTLPPLPVAPASDAAYVAPHAVGSCDPSYPAAARQHGLQGRVLLHLDISIDGAVVASVKSSSGSTLLDNAALGKAPTCRFAPATRGGVSIAGSVDQPFDFRLED
jgi:periplasmic protein TonB